MNELLQYGFEFDGKSYFRGIGSICNGMSIRMTENNGMVNITVKTYYCDGIEENDTVKNYKVFRGNIWEYIPSFIYRVKR